VRTLPNECSVGVWGCGWGGERRGEREERRGEERRGRKLGRADWEERKRQRPALGGERPPFLPSGLVLLSRCGACACVYVCVCVF
jgi:hypothetical protein